MLFLVVMGTELYVCHHLKHCNFILTAFEDIIQKLRRFPTFHTHSLQTQHPEEYFLFSNETVQGRLFLKFWERLTLLTFILSTDFKFNTVIKHFIGVALQYREGQCENLLDLFTYFISALLEMVQEGYSYHWKLKGNSVNIWNCSNNVKEKKTTKSRKQKSEVLQILEFIRDETVDNYIKVIYKNWSAFMWNNRILIHCTLMKSYFFN